ncbi:MAG: sporulation transcriptional regulator SpoIIID [Eubacteriales bacterium SKADARSKE-1]|nr:sporulation transcriptional regulator SpoIIID [Eubacteriales bacterium SKADARSKE-1]
MKGIVEERAASLGEYIIESKATVRSAAKKFGVSKSTVFGSKHSENHSSNKLLFIVPQYYNGGFIAPLH